MTQSSSISLIVVITYMKNYSLTNSTSYPKYISSGIFIYLKQRLVNSLLTILFIAIVIIILIRDSFDRVPQKQQSTNKAEYYHIQDEQNRSGMLSDLGLKERNALSSPSLLISKKKIDDF